MLVGKLRHASLILPAAKGFFTPVNSAIRGSPKIVGLGRDSELRAALEDILLLLKILSSCPTHVKELVPSISSVATTWRQRGQGEYGSHLQNQCNRVSGATSPPLILHPT
jgi:hypothetical protein